MPLEKRTPRKNAEPRHKEYDTPGGGPGTDRGVQKVDSVVADPDH